MRYNINAHRSDGHLYYLIRDGVYIDVVSGWVDHAEHMPAVWTEERLLRHSTQFLGSAVNLLQTWNLQLEMDWAIFGKRVFLHQEHDFRTGQIVFDCS